MSTITIDYLPYAYQEQFHASDSRFRVIVGGRRVGKSEMVVQHLIRHAIETPHGLSWYVAPTYKDAYEIGFTKFMEHIEQLLPAISKVHQTHLCIEWVNGHVTYFKGAENEKSLRGRGLTLVVLDEVAFMKEQVWSRIIRPSLMDHGGDAILLTTPNGRNWFHQLYEACPRWNNWSRWHWPTEMNPLIGEDEISELKQTLAEFDYRQEIMGEFVTLSGSVYDDYTIDNHADWDFVYDDTEHAIGIGLDFGFASATAVCFMAHNINTDIVECFDQLYLSRTPMEVIADQIDQVLDRHGIPKRLVKLYTDPAGNAEELSSGLSPVDMLRRRNFVVENKGTRIFPGVAMVRSFIRNMAGERKLMVHVEECPDVDRSLLGYIYATGAHGIILEEPFKDGIHDHMCDAIRYYFVNRFDTAKYVAKHPDMHQYGQQRRSRPVIKRCSRCRKPFVSTTPVREPPFTCSECQDTPDQRLLKNRPDQRVYRRPS